MTKKSEVISAMLKQKKSYVIAHLNQTIKRFSLHAYMCVYLYVESSKIEIYLTKKKERKLSTHFYNYEPLAYRHFFLLYFKRVDIIVSR